MNKLIKICIAVVVGAILLNGATFTVPQATQAVVTKFGKPVRNAAEPGLHWKLPFFEDVRYVDKRVLTWDGYPNQVNTKDKKYISVDTTARWQIVDALKFMKSVQNKDGGLKQLSTVLDSATRSVIASHNLVEAVRNTNDIIKQMEEQKKEKQAEMEKSKTDKDSVSMDGIDEEVYSNIEEVAYGREKLSIMIKDMSEKELLNSGIRLVDVQFRRISYERGVELKVFERMISERNRIAEKIRAIGAGESAKIRGKMQKDLSKIESESYRTVEETKGEADAKALKIYAATFSKNPELYEFLKSMEGYKKIFSTEQEMIISPDSQYFKHLKGI